MKYDFTTVVKDLSGVSIKNEKGEELTLKYATQNALFAMTQEDSGTTGEEKYTRYRLASKVNKDGLVDLRSEDVTKLKERIGKAYGPLVVGFAFDFFESPIIEEKKEK